MPRTAEEAAIESRRAQGLPDKVEDPVALAKIRTILCAARLEEAS